MNEPELVTLVGGIPLFRDLSRKDLKRIAAQLRPTTFEPRENIVTEGESGADAFILVTGTAKVIVHGRTRNRVSAGALVGEVAVLAGGRRTATVQAETQVEALSLSPFSLLVLLENHWSITHVVLRSLAYRLYEADRSGIA